MGGFSRMKKLLAIILAGLMLTGIAYAQSPVEPKLTEVETLKIQILNLQYELRTEQLKSAQLTVSAATCQATLLKDPAPLSKIVREVEAEIEKSHEGFDFDITTGKFSPKEKPVEKK